MVATLCMLPIIAAFAGIIAAPPGYIWLDYLMLMIIGCFVYPVLGLITVAALDMVSKKAIGTAAGFIGLFGYIGRLVQDKGFGRLLDQLTDDTWCRVCLGCRVVCDTDLRDHRDAVARAAVEVAAAGVTSCSIYHSAGQSTVAWDPPSLSFPGRR